MEETTGSSSRGVSGKKRLWTEAEDNILMEYVSKHGDSNWSNVQRVTGLSRTGKSCRLRWRDQLRPGLKKEQFSPEEEKLIGDLHYKMGNQWAIIAQYLPGRTDNAVKNFWYNRCKRRKRTGLKAVVKGPSNVPHSCPPTENHCIKTEESPLNLTETCEDAPLPLNLSELTSIQHVESLADNMQHKDLVNPTSTGTASNSERFDLNTFHERYDPMLTDGDIVEYWLNSSSSDGSLDQECICQQAICANYGSMGNVAATTFAESVGSIVGAQAEDKIDSFPELLQSSSSDVLLGQKSVCQDTICANDGTINNAAATDESTNMLNSSIQDDLVIGEPIFEAADWANYGTVNDAASVAEQNNWCNSPYADDFLYQQGVFQDDILSENDGGFDNLAASSTISVPNHGWDHNYIFWRTPFFQ